MKNCFLLLLSLSLIIAYAICKSKISFTVTGLEGSLCFDSLGDYTFDINGEFSSEKNLDDEITIYMESPSNAKVRCTPFPTTEFSSSLFQCHLNVCLNPLNSVSVLVPTKPPTSGAYEFPNWEEVLGANAGVSNLVKKNVQCLPSETNTFIPSNLKSKGCSGIKNVFEIEGEWQDKESDNIPDSDDELEIEISNDNKDIATCYPKSKKVIQCNYKGYGEIKFTGEKYFSEPLAVYKLKENDLSITVKKCDNSGIIKSNFYILSLLILILLF